MTSTADTTTTTETWTYAGRRVAANGKRYLYAWIDPSGEQLHYAKLKALAIGGRYGIDVARDGDRITVTPSAIYTGETLDTDEVRGWKAEDAAAVQKIESGKAERRAAEDDEVQDALDVLRRHFVACQSYSSKWGFAQWVAAEVARPVRRTNDDDV